MFFKLCITTTGEESPCGNEHFPIIAPYLPHQEFTSGRGTQLRGDGGAMASGPRLRQVLTGCSSEEPEESKQLTSSHGKSRWKATTSPALIQNWDGKKGFGCGGSGEDAVERRSWRATEEKKSG